MIIIFKPRNLISLAVFLFVLILCCGAASAATFNIDSTQSIQEAVNTAHTGDTINLAAGTYKQHNITVNKNLTINGPTYTGSTPNAAIDAQQQGRVFNINSGVKVTLKNLVIKNGKTDSIGSGINNEGDLTINKCTITQNTGTGGCWGGGIFNRGNLTMISSNVCYNTGKFGGGIWIEDGKVTISSSNISNNTASGGHGGGIVNWGTLNIKNSNINSNTANCGGGIYNIDAILNMTSCKMNYNSAANVGGALYNEAWMDAPTIASLNGCTFNGNNAGTSGGAICATGTLNVTSCTFKENWVPAGGKGGAISNGGNLKVTGSEFSANNASYGCSINNEGGNTNRVINYNWFINYVGTSSAGYEIYSSYPDLTESLDARYNWWGSNSPGPVHGSVSVTPCLKDTTGTPKISSTDPTNGAVNISASKTIKVNFNENVKPGSNYWIELKNSIGTLIPFNSSISGTTLNIDPNNNLAESLYTLIIHTGAVNDLAGNPVALKSFKFSVGTSPKVASSNPVNGATKVARNKTITVTFNESVKSGTNYGKITLKSSAGKTVTITKSISGKVLTIKHSSLLAAKTKYTLTLYSGCVKDLAGNPLAAKTITFTTGSS